MDRISRALEKNRSRQPRNTEWSERTKENLKTSVLENIEYTKTRQVHVSQNILIENRVIAGSRSDPRAAAFKILRTQVLHAMRQNKWTSIAVTGPTTGIGKSTVALNLAVSMSLEVNQTVLLVDLDLRRPSLHNLLNFEPEHGILDYLKGEVPLCDVLVNPNFKRLVLLPGRGTTSESSELLSSPKMTELAKELKSRYPSRVIIYDLPPLMSHDDAMVFLPNVDSTLLVVENGRNTQSEVQNSMRLLQGTNLIGTILNKGDEVVEDYY